MSIRRQCILCGKETPDNSDIIIEFTNKETFKGWYSLSLLICSLECINNPQYSEKFNLITKLMDAMRNPNV